MKNLILRGTLALALGLTSAANAQTGVVSSSNVIGQGSPDSPVTSALNWNSRDIVLFGGAAYDGGLLVQDGPSAFFADDVPDSFVFADGTATSGGALFFGATPTDTTVAMSDTGSMIAVSISSADRQPLVGAGVTGPAGPFTSWRIDVGSTAYPDSIEWTGAGTINVLSSGFTVFNAAGGSLGTFALEIDAATATEVGGVGLLGLDGGDIAGFDLAELVVFWEYEVIAPCEPCDTNCDGFIDAFDVEPFLGLLFGPGVPCSACAGDANADGIVDPSDIDPFADCLFAPDSGGGTGVGGAGQPGFRIFFDRSGNAGSDAAPHPGSGTLSYDNPVLPPGGGRLYIYGEFQDVDQTILSPNFDITIDGGTITGAWNYNGPGQDDLTNDQRWDAAEPNPLINPAGTSVSFTAVSMTHMGLTNGAFADNFDVQHDNTRGHGDTLLGYIDVEADDDATVWLTVGRLGCAIAGSGADTPISFGYDDPPIRAYDIGVRTQIADATVNPPPTIPGFTITDGGCQYDLFGLIGQRLTENGGIANLVTGAIDHIFQNWFWYRGTGDTREYALSTQVFGSAVTNHARLVYKEPIGDGNILDALVFDLEYTISDLSTFAIAGVPGAAPPACVRCEIVIAIKVRNLTPAPVSVDLFSYNDMDLNGNSAGDSAVIAGNDNQIQLISDLGPGGTNCIASGVYKVSSTDHVAWEIDSFPNILQRLGDALPDVLFNAVSPFGPGDYTGAQQWKINLGPAGSVSEPPFDEWVGSVVKEIIIHAPGDVNGDCVVNLQDLAFLLSNFGLICTP